jgi:opacity protein-like surface antigen
MKIKLLSSLILATSLSYAAQPINGWYGEVFGGYTYMPSNLFTTVNGLTFTDVHYNSGYHGGGRLGYKDNPLRYEGEISYLTAFPSSFNVNFIKRTLFSGQTSATTALANIYYDFPELILTLTPFISAGIGYAYISSHLLSTGPTFVSDFRATDNVFAYQGSVGLAYNFVDNYSLDIAYRYLGTSHVDRMGSQFQAHMASAGVTYRFDGVYYK